MEAVGKTIATSIARGFGDVLGDELAREVRNLKEGKGGIGKKLSLNDFSDIGNAAAEGYLGKRGNLPDLLTSSYNVASGNNSGTDLAAKDLQIRDLETINFFGKFNKELFKLKEERNAILQEMAQPFGGVGASVNLGGLQYVLDPVTNTLKAVGNETKKLAVDFGNTAKEAEKTRFDFK